MLLQRKLSLTTRLLLRVVVGLLPVIALVVAAMSIQHFRGEDLRNDLEMRRVGEGVLTEFLAFRRAAEGVALARELEAEAAARLAGVSSGLERLLDPHHGHVPRGLDAARESVRTLAARVEEARSAEGFTRLRPEIDATGQLIEVVVAECAAHFGDAVKGFVDQSLMARTVVATLLILVLLGVLLFAYQTIRRFVEPLKRAVALARRIGRGAPLDDAPADPREDTGNVLSTMREMHADLQRYRRDVTAYQAGLQDKVAELATSQASLEEVHRLARIGTWNWQPAQGAAHWSAQLRTNLGLGGASPAPSLRVFLRVVPRDERAALVDEFRILLHGPGERSCEHHALVGGDAPRVLLHRVRSEHDAEGTLTRMFATVQDISERRRASDEIRRLSRYDALTRLPNRALLGERLATAIADHERVAVLFINIDRFRRINASLGQGVGDRVLVALAQRLVDATRALVPGEAGGERSAFVARFGGDEFVVVFRELATREEVAVCATRLIADLTTPLQIDAEELAVAVHVGIALGPDDAREASTLIGHAASASVLTRQAGLNRFHFFTADMNDEVAARLRVERDLRQAIDAGDQFFLVYQPKVDLRSGDLVGVEALIRWHHPVRGVLAPGAFIELAEEFGLIASIGCWVVREVCTQLARWQAAGLQPLPVAINISGSCFHNEMFAAGLAEVCAGHGVDPALIVVEITESVLMDGAEASTRTLSALSKAGFRLSIDDFGTGYSSLAYLHRFPIDEIKIDRSFVCRIGNHGGERTIVAAILALGHNLAMKVVAEGVETDAQLRALRELGCEQAQGYLFARPLGAEVIAEMLRASPRFEVGRTLRAA